MPTVHARTLARAAEIVGGVSALADRLHVSTEGLRLWMSGKADPPSRVFFEAIDIVLGHQMEGLAQHGDDPALRQLRRDDDGRV